jgi:fibronectin type 3 domain-containing protein
VITVQRVTNAIPNPPSNPNPPCVAYNTHASNLSWNASTTSGASYNVYRATTVGGTYTLIASALSAGTYCSNGSTCAWGDSAVTAGVTYYYEVTAVAAGVESAPTSPVAGTIPSP